MDEEKSVDLKMPTSVEQQIEKLKSRGCIIEDDEVAKEILTHINYYRLTSYFLPFKTNTDCYKVGTSLKKVHKIYEFDKKFRSLISMQIETIEIMYRMQIAYRHAHKYGPTGYLNEQSFGKNRKFTIENKVMPLGRTGVSDSEALVEAQFIQKTSHEIFLCNIKKYISRSKDKPFVIHHLDKYNGNFPIWVIVELFEFGVLSKFFSNMHTKDKKAIAKKINISNYEYIESWLLCLSHLRNKCAHYERLYYTRMLSKPKTPMGFEYSLSESIFDYIVILKLLIGNFREWENEFIPQLGSLIEEYNEFINLNLIGFPVNWEEILTSKSKYIMR